MCSKKGNISILVIFVLLASSLLGVLAMNFVQSMMKQSATTFNYYQSYYLAKAGIEFGLSELEHRGIGFEQTVLSGSHLLLDNFTCAGRCNLWFSLSGTSTILSQQFRTDTGCQHPFVLSGGGSLVVPLSRDNFDKDLVDGFSTGISYINLYGALPFDVITEFDTQVTWGILITSGEDLAADGIFFRSGSLKDGLDTFITDFEAYLKPLDIYQTFTNLSNQYIEPYRFFLMISNPSEENISFCLASKEALPTQQYYIKSRGVYDKQQLGLEAVYKQPIPDFLLNAYMSY